MLPSNVQRQEVRQILGLQAVVVAVMGLAWLVFAGEFEARSGLYGGMCALVNTWMLGRRVRLALEAARRTPGREVMVLYIGAIQRFVTVLVLFILGMGGLKLSPVPLLLGFAVAQGAYLIRGIRQSAVG
jgi:ATP synthase protein I